MRSPDRENYISVVRFSDESSCGDSVQSDRTVRPTLVTCSDFTQPSMLIEVPIVVQFKPFQETSRIEQI